MFNYFHAMTDSKKGEILEKILADYAMYISTMARRLTINEKIRWEKSDGSLCGSSPHL